MANINETEGRIARGKDNGKPKEGLQNPIKVRLVDWEKDAKAIADIFNNTKVIEHEAGVAPSQSKRNIPLFRNHIEEKIHLSPGATMTKEALKDFANDIIVATPSEVRASFEKMPRVETYVAVVEGRVVGTASFEKPSSTQAGKRVGTIFKVAVDPDAPKAIESSQHGKGIARNLIRAINKRAKELSLASIGASVIKGVEGYQSAISLFVNEGYTMGPESPGDTLGWDNKQEGFVERTTFKLQLNVSESSK